MARLRARPSGVASGGSAVPKKAVSQLDSGNWVPALDGLNGALYSETGQHWQGEELWRAIKAIPIAERVQDPVGDTGLPPLYPK